MHWLRYFGFSILDDIYAPDDGLNFLRGCWNALLLTAYVVGGLVLAFS